MMVSQDIGDTRLLALADVIEKTNYYDQISPHSCAYGHYRRHFNEFLSLEHEFHLSHTEANELFGYAGCGDARHNNLKAARYIRDFVARRNVKPEVVNEGLLGKRESAEQEARGVVCETDA
jgi:hypothetical protein